MWSDLLYLLVRGNQNSSFQVCATLGLKFVYLRIFMWRENLRSLLNGLSSYIRSYTKWCNRVGPRLYIIKGWWRIIILVNLRQPEVNPAGQTLWWRPPIVLLLFIWLINLVAALVFQEFVVFRSQMLNIVTGQALRILRLKRVLMIVHG